MYLFMNLVYLQKNSDYYKHLFLVLAHSPFPIPTFSVKTMVD